MQFELDPILYNDIRTAIKKTNKVLYKIQYTYICKSE